MCTCSITWHDVDSNAAHAQGVSERSELTPCNKLFLGIYPFWCEGGSTDAEESGPNLACHTFTCSISTHHWSSHKDTSMTSVHDHVILPAFFATHTNSSICTRTFYCTSNLVWENLIKLHIHIIQYITKVSLTNECFSSPGRSKQEDPLWRTAKTFEYITASITRQIILKFATERKNGSLGYRHRFTDLRS